MTRGQVLWRLALLALCVAVVVWGAVTQVAG